MGFDLTELFNLSKFTYFERYRAAFLKENLCDQLKTFFAKFKKCLAIAEAKNAQSYEFQFQFEVTLQ